MFSRETINQVLDATNIVDVVGQQATLKRQGKQWVGLCPFHQERSPSFSVNAEKGVYYCFGCQRSGDTITFLRETQHLTFSEAVEHLAEIAGIHIETDDNPDERQRRDHLASLARLVEHWHQHLVLSPAAAQARAYLQSRGVTSDEISEHRLGLAYARSLAEVGIDHDTATNLGLLSERGTLLVRGRLVFPLCDARGTILGVSGRALADDTKPKYINSAESAYYRKRRVLFGLPSAKSAIVKADRVVVCEGNFDVLALRRAGVVETVATCGTALTSDHLRLLRGFTRNIILAYDADPGGHGAMARLVRTEQESDVSFSVAEFPQGDDPASFVASAKDPAQEVAARIEAAKPLLRWHIDRLLASDLSTPENAARTAAEIRELLARHPDQVLAQRYAAYAAEHLGVAAHAVMSGPVAEHPKRKRATTPPAPTPVERLSRDALLAAVHRPERAVALQPWLFHGTAREVFEALLDSDTIPEALGRCGNTAAALLASVAVSKEPSDEEADAAVTAFVLANIHDQVEQLVHSADPASEAVATARALRSAGDQLRQNGASWVEHAVELLKPLLDHPASPATADNRPPYGEANAAADRTHQNR